MIRNLALPGTFQQAAFRMHTAADRWKWHSVLENGQPVLSENIPLQTHTQIVIYVTNTMGLLTHFCSCIRTSHAGYTGRRPPF